MTLTRLVHIRDKASVRHLAHDRADRNLDDQVLRALAAAKRRRAVFAVFGGILAFITEIHQRMHVFIREQDDIAAVAAVAAVRSAVLHEFFAMERNCAIAAVTGLGCDFYLIDKHNFLFNPLGEYRSCLNADYPTDYNLKRLSRQGFWLCFEAISSIRARGNRLIRSFGMKKAHSSPFFRVFD